LKGNKKIVYAPKILKYFMVVVRFIPRSIFDKL
jgi:hypothetical protein